MGWTGTDWEEIQSFSVSDSYNGWKTYEITAAAGEQQFKAYTGFAARVDEGNDSTDLINLQRMVLKVKPAYLEFSEQNWAELGQFNVDSNNLDAFNSLVHLVSSQSSDAQIVTDLTSLTAAEIQAYESALQVVTDFITGASQVAPTLANFQTIASLLESTDSAFEVSADQVDGINQLLVAQRISDQPSAVTLVENLHYAISQQESVLSTLSALQSDTSHWRETFMFDYMSERVTADLTQSGEYSSSYDADDAFADGGSYWISWHQNRVIRNADPWLGYVDSDGSQGKTILKSVYLDPAYSMEIDRFAVEGLNPDTNRWELIEILSGDNLRGTLPVDSQRVYSGYRAVFYLDGVGNFNHDDRIEIDQIRFDVMAADRIVNPLDIEALGVVGITENNVDLVLNALANRDNTSDLDITTARAIAQSAVDTFEDIAGGSLSSLEIADLRALGFEGAEADNLPAIKQALSNLLASGLPINANTLSDALAAAEYNIAMVQRLALAIDNSSDGAESFWGLRDYVPQLTNNSHPGLVTLSEYDGTSLAYKAFDGSHTYASVSSAYRTMDVSAQQIAYIGWFDAEGIRGPAILKRVVIENYTDSRGVVHEAGNLVVKGYNPFTELWEEIKSYPIYDSNVEALYIDIESNTPYEGFRLDIAGDTNSSAILQEVRFEADIAGVFTQAALNDVELDNLALASRAIATTAGQTTTLAELESAIAAELTQTEADLVSLISSVRSGSVNLLTVQMLAEIGVEGATEKNIAVVETALAAANEGQTDDLAGIKSIAGTAISSWAEAQIMGVVNSQLNYAGSEAAYSFVPTITSRKDTDAEGLILDSLNNVHTSGENYYDLYKLFDDKGYSTTATERYVGKTGDDDHNPSAQNPTILGWFDRTGNKLSQLEYIEFTTYGYLEWDRVPQTFNVEGYDAASGEWKLIQRFVDVTHPDNIPESGHVLRIDLDKGGLYSGFRLLVEDTRAGYNTIQLTELDFYTVDIENYFQQAGWDFVKDSEIKIAEKYLVEQSQMSDAATLTTEQVKAGLDVYLAEQRLFEYASADDLNYVDAPTVYDYQALGISAVDASNLGDHNAMLVGSSEDNVSVIRAASDALLANDYPGSSASETLYLAKINNYDPVNGDYILSLDDFAALGITGVSLENILMLGELITQSDDFTNTSLDELQALVTTANLTQTLTLGRQGEEEIYEFNSTGGDNLAARYIWFFDEGADNQIRSFTSMEAINDGVNIALNADVSGNLTSSVNNYSAATDGGGAEPWNSNTSGSSNLVYLPEAGSYAKVDLGAVYSLDNIGIWARSDSYWSESTDIRVFSSLSDVANSYTTLQNSADVAEAAFGNEINFTQNQTYTIDSTNQGGWNIDGSNSNPDAWADASVTSNPSGVTQTLTNGALVVGAASPVIGGVLGFNLPKTMELEVSVNGQYQGVATVNNDRTWSFDLASTGAVLSNTSDNSITLTVRGVDGTEYSSMTQTIEYLEVGTSENDGAVTIDALTEVSTSGVYFKASMPDYLSLGAVVKVFVDGVEIGFLQDTGSASLTIEGWLEADIANGNHQITARIDNLISGEQGTMSLPVDLAAATPAAEISKLLVDNGTALESYSNIADDSYGDTTPDIEIDIQDFNAGDDYFLIIDGTEIDIDDPTSAEQTAGTAIRADIDVAALDATQDGIVDISVKIVHSDGAIVVSNDFTYDYS